MSNQIQLTRFYEAPIDEIFRYLVEPRLIEKWSAPDGMSLKIPYYEARVGGRYRYEHTNKDGTYLCEGHVEEIVPGKKLKVVDEWIKDPSGKTIMENLPCEMNLRKIGVGTEISIIQSNFASEEMRAMCEEGWNQCFDKLQRLIGTTQPKSDITDQSMRY